MAIKIIDLFDVVSGDYHAVKELEQGKVPLVSCGDTDNGVMGYYDIPREKQYEGALTVAYNGSWPIMTKYHPYKFGAKDDVAVLIPKRSMSSLSLLYVAALLNRMTWRYSYGRKCFREKLEQVELAVPIVSTDGFEEIDETAIRATCPVGVDGIVEGIATRAGSWMQSV